jgi:hypothetical protein
MENDAKKNDVPGMAEGVLDDSKKDVVGDDLDFEGDGMNEHAGNEEATDVAGDSPDDTSTTDISEAEERLRIARLTFVDSLAELVAAGQPLGNDLASTLHELLGKSLLKGITSRMCHIFDIKGG